MKPPAFLSTALIAFRRGIAGVSSRLGGFLGSMKNGIQHGSKTLQERFHGGRGGAKSTAISTSRSLFLVMVSALAVLVASLLLLVGLLSRRPSKAITETSPKNVTTAMSPGELPRSGPALASMLLIPGDDPWPYPLALEPKARYTEADAEAMRPDMGMVDISELVRRRKAELEALFDAVD